MSTEDRAQEQELKMWEIANAPRPQQPVYEPDQQGYGPAYCSRCEDPMPALRRRDGRLYCTSCQSAREIRGYR